MTHQTSAGLVERHGHEPAHFDRRVRLGILGAGYVTAQSHLPACSGLADVQVVALADVHLARAQRLADRYGVSYCVEDYHQLFDRVDAVIVALPHHLHACVSVEFLNRGIHVLCEKPMALTVGECQQMIDATRTSGAKLAVGHVRRFYDNMLTAKRLIETRFLGAVERFEMEESVDFERFPASPFTVQPPSGGVLWDTGPHAVDLLLWWFGDFERVQYRDDAMGGVEANCELAVTTAAGAFGTMELSRTRRLENTVRVYCESGTLRVPTLNPLALFVESPTFSGPLRISGIESSNEESPGVRIFRRQLNDFAAAILEDRPPTVSAEHGARTVAAIERCRQVRQPLDTPRWMQLPGQLAARMDKCHHSNS